MNKRWTAEEKAQCVKLLNGGSTPEQIAEIFKTNHGSVRGVFRRLGIKLRSSTERVASVLVQGVEAPPSSSEGAGIQDEVKGDDRTISAAKTRITSAEKLLEFMQVDLGTWEIERQIVNKWEVGGKPGNNNSLVSNTDSGFAVEPLFQIKIWLKRKSQQHLGIESLLKAIESGAPLLKAPAVRSQKLKHRRAFEIAIMDPHIGLLCEPPEADGKWNIEIAEQTIMAAIDDLIEKAKHLGPFEQIFFPIGNDLQHSDNVFHTTTAGTPQPEAMDWHRVYDHAERIMIEMVNRLREVGKEMYIYEIPGNHSRMADFTIARVLKAYFRHDKNIHIDASASPYKFHHYGTNLIGYEHGHSVNALRLASIMAHECSDIWGQTTYREFHLGDQHRKGSSKPSSMEEQGVSIEYCPALTASNAWHRLKGLNHGSRGAMAWVWNYETGPEARFQYNIKNTQTQSRL